MPRLTPEQLRASKRLKREDLSRKLVQACLGTEVDINAALEEIDQVFFMAIEYGLWFWFTDLLPKHFGKGATETYGYPNRKSGYLIGKYTGMAMDGGRRSRFKFPKEAAYRIAGTKREASTAPDPYPLEFSGELKTRVTMSPAALPTVRRAAKGYIGKVVIELPAYIRREDINALLRDTPKDLELIFEKINQFVREAFV